MESHVVLQCGVGDNETLFCAELHREIRWVWNLSKAFSIGKWTRTRVEHISHRIQHDAFSCHIIAKYNNNNSNSAAACTGTIRTKL